MSTPVTNQVQNQETRELTELLSLFHIALKNIRFYPAGHDVVKTRTTAAHQLLGRLLAKRKIISFGIAKNTITFADTPLGENLSACSSLAQLLSRHEIVSLTFSHGVSQHSLFLFLKTVGVLPEHRNNNKSLEQELSSLNISNIKIETVDYNYFDRIQGTISEKDRGQAPENIAADSISWMDFTKKINSGMLGHSRNYQDVEHNSNAPPNPEALAAALNTNGNNQPELLKEFSILLDQMLQQSPQQNASLPSFGGKELNKILISLNPNLRHQFLKATLERCDQNQKQTNPEKILGKFSDSLVLDMLQQVNTKEATVSPALLNLIEKISHIRFTPDAAGETSIMSKQEISNLLEPEKYDQYVGKEYHQTLHQLSNTKASVYTPPADFPMERHLATLEEAPLDRQIVRATLIFMENAEGATDYSEFANRLMEFAFGLPETGSFDLLLSIAKSLTRHASKKKSAATRKVAATYLADLADSDFLDQIHSALQDASDQEKETAVSFLIYLGPTILDCLIKIFYMQKQVSEEDPLIAVFKKFRIETLTRVFRMLPKENTARTQKLLILIQYLGTQGTARLLHALLDHEDLDIRSQVLDLLLPLQDEEAFATLESMLNSKNNLLVDSAIELCNIHKPTACIPDLLHLLDYQFIKEAAIERNRKLFLVLGRIGDSRALPALEKIAFSKWPFHRQSVATMKRVLFYSLKGYSPKDRLSLVQKGMQSKDAEIRKICSTL